MIRQTDSWSPFPEAPVPSTAHPLEKHYTALVRHVCAQRGETGLCLGVTSCQREEGVSTVALNLAVAAARNSSGRVLLVDANLSHPALAARFGLPAGQGLTELLAGEAQPSQVLRATPIDSLWLLAPGQRQDLREDRPELAACLRLLREQFWLTILDLPIADDLSPCVAVARQLDGVLLVVEAERTHRDLVRRAKARLERNQTRLLGVVFNKGRW